MRLWIAGALLGGALALSSAAHATGTNFSGGGGNLLFSVSSPQLADRPAKPQPLTLPNVPALAKLAVASSTLPSLLAPPHPPLSSRSPGFPFLPF